MRHYSSSDATLCDAGLEFLRYRLPLHCVCPWGVVDVARRNPDCLVYTGSIYPRAASLRVLSFPCSFGRYQAPAAVAVR